MFTRDDAGMESSADFVGIWRVHGAEGGLAWRAVCALIESARSACWRRVRLGVEVVMCRYVKRISRTQ